MRIGIDLGGTKIEAIALDDNAKTLLRRRVPTPAEGYRAILDAVADPDGYRAILRCKPRHNRPSAGTGRTPFRRRGRPQSEAIRCGELTASTVSVVGSAPAAAGKPPALSTAQAHSSRKD
jgi:hypothetical protein